MKCPHCGSENVEKVREWDMPRMGYHVVHYACRNCGGRFNHYAGRGREFVLRVKAARGRAGRPPGETRPSHDELVRELLELGEWLGFVAGREEPTPDGLYRLDVVWRDAEGHAPLKAFEVELSGEVDKALARLAHAYDMWRCEQLWLIVSDEARAERALRLVEPRLRGSFARIKSRLGVLGWEDLHGLYAALRQHARLLARLAGRL